MLMRDLNEAAALPDCSVVTEAQLPSARLRVRPSMELRLICIQPQLQQA